MKMYKSLLISCILLSFKLETVNLKKLSNYGQATGALILAPSIIMYLFKHSFRQSIIDPRVPQDQFIDYKFLLMSGKAIDKLDVEIRLCRNLSILGLGLIATSLVLYYLNVRHSDVEENI